MRLVSKPQRKKLLQDINKVRERGPMRWTVAGKGEGEGAKRRSCDLDGLIRLPTNDPTDDPADGEREATCQWIKDSNEFMAARHPPSEEPDLYAHWNLGRVPVVGNVVDEPPWWEKYELPMLPSAAGMRGGGGCPAVPLSPRPTSSSWQLTSARLGRGAKSVKY